MPPVNSRPVAAPKSRKSLLKQPGSFVGRSQPQTQSIAGTPLPFEPLLLGNQSNAQFSYTTGTLRTEGSTLPAASAAFGSQSNPQFSFNSGTLPAEETSLSVAPVIFGSQSNAPFAFNSNKLPAEGFSFAATPEPLVFGNESNARFAFNSGTLPALEETFLPAAPLTVGNQSTAKPELRSDTEPEEESIEQMVADMEAAMAKFPTPSVTDHVPLDPNYGLDMSFGLDTDLPPAIPNVAQGPNVTQYPDPTVLDSGCSLPYFFQNSNILDPDLALLSFSQDPESTVDPSFIPGPSIARDPVAQDPSLDPELNLTLDPRLGLANEHGNYQPFATSTMPTAPGATQYPDPNFPDNARSLPYFIQDCNIPDPLLPRINFSKEPKSTADPSCSKSQRLSKIPSLKIQASGKSRAFPPTLT